MINRLPKPRLTDISAIGIAIAIGVFMAFVPNVTLTLPTGDANAHLVFHSSHIEAAADGQALFEQKCKGCHSLGGGRGVGPDLAGITAVRDRDWLVRFITVPDKLIAQGDPIAKQIVQQYGLPMPNLGIVDEDAEALLAYIDAQSPGSQSSQTQTQPTTAPPLSATSLTVGAATGRDLFTGERAFQNGGVSCLSCHNINAAGLLGGGTVGADLTRSFGVMGDSGLTALLKAAPFPMMKEVYAARPLSDDEIASLRAYLKEAGDAPPTQSQRSVLFIVIGGAGALVIIGLLQFRWRGRLVGVRRQLVNGGSK